MDRPYLDVNRGVTMYSCPSQNPQNNIHISLECPGCCIPLIPCLKGIRSEVLRLQLDNNAWGSGPQLYLHVKLAASPRRPPSPVDKADVTVCSPCYACLLRVWASERMKEASQSETLWPSSLLKCLLPTCGLWGRVAIPSHDRTHEIKGTGGPPQQC